MRFKQSGHNGQVGGVNFAVIGGVISAVRLNRFDATIFHHQVYVSEQLFIFSVKQPSRMNHDGPFGFGVGPRQIKRNILLASVDDGYFSKVVGGHVNQRF